VHCSTDTVSYGCTAVVVPVRLMLETGTTPAGTVCALCWRCHGLELWQNDLRCGGTSPCVPEGDL
jgi:hypothetical protein